MNLEKLCCLEEGEAQYGEDQKYPYVEFESDKNYRHYKAHEVIAVIRPDYRRA